MSGNSFLSRAGLGFVPGTITGTVVKNSAGKPVQDSFTGDDLVKFQISGYDKKKEFVQNIIREFGVARAISDLRNRANALGNTGLIGLLNLHITELGKQIGILHPYFIATVTHRFAIEGDTSSAAVSYALDDIEDYVKAAVKKANEYYPLAAIEELIDDAKISN